MEKLALAPTTLAQTIWIGGSPCAGKSTLAAMLARRHGLTHYSCDDALTAHVQRSNTATYPLLHQLAKSSWNEIWTRPVERQIREELAFYREEFPLILEDLTAFPPDTPIVAEGTALLPELVAPLLQGQCQAIWLVPTAAFQREHYVRRPWLDDILRQCADPALAFDNWMRRDIGFADVVEGSARALGLPVIRVDGKEDAEEVLTRVCGALRLSSQ